MIAVAALSVRAFAEYVACALRVFCAVCGLAAIPAHATAGQPGTLDPFWANGSALGSGKLITAVGPRHDRPSSMLAQPDGRVLVAGFCPDIGLCATRYNIDGTLDANFGNAGTLPQVFVPNVANVTPSLALLPDGKFLLTGTCADLEDNDFCVFRFNADGNIDATFGASGSTSTPIGSADDRPRAMRVQPDGKIVVAGTCNNGVDSDFCAARYLPNGGLGASFGSGGKVVTAFSIRDDGVNAATLQPDGKLLLAGFCRSGSFDKFCVARYDRSPFPAPACSLDIDGDTQVRASTDSLIHARIALGIRGDAVVAGITFPINTQRKTWTQIRGHLVSTCGMVLSP